MKILGLDFETTGLDEKTRRVTEVGMVLWDSDLRQPLKAMGYLVNPGEDAVWEPGVEQLNGITKDMCREHGYDYERALKQFLLWYQPVEAVCAHNGGKFDRPVLKAWANQFGYDWIPDMLWIDTKTDLPLPASYSRKLAYMPVDHGILPNPYPHRAVFDVMQMLKVLDCYPLPQVLEIAKSPTLTVRALVDYDTRELAKTRGYHAQYEEGKFKMWSMAIKECFLEKEKAEAGFPIEIIG